jgi:hypothetical protein
MQYKKNPSLNDKNKNIKQLGYWLSHQQHNYKNKKNIMKDETIRKKYEEFIEIYNKYFQSNNENCF